MSTMKFCRECNNILYPKEDKDQKILLYACRNCDHQVLSLSLIIIIIIIFKLWQRAKFRFQCLFFAGKSYAPATARGEEGMTLFFVCCNPNCGHRWRD
nr:DNA-directed RNA polymerases II, IV and V subunit 9A [Quercus suber]